MMLAFALDYQEALKAITANPELELRVYELSKEEWEIAKQLRDVLKVFVTYCDM